MGKRELGGMAALLAALGWVYAPVVCCYGFSDDYALLDYVYRMPWWFAKCLPTHGRPLNAFLLPALYRFAGTVCGLARLRILNVAFLALSAICLLICLSRAGWAPMEAGAVALTMCVMPAFVAQATWGCMAVAVISFAPAVIAGWVAAEPLGGCSAGRILRLVFAAAVLVGMFMIYQPSGAAFWLGWAIRVFSGERRQAAMRPFLLAGGIFFGAAAVYYAWFRSGLWPFRIGEALRSPGEIVRHARLSLHVASRLVEFACWPLLDSLALFVLQRTRHVRVWVALAVLLGIGAGLLKLWHRDGRRAWQATLVAAALPLLAYLPSFASSQVMLGFRKQAVLSATIVFLLAWSAREWLGARSRRAVLLALAGAAAVAARDNLVRGVVRPQVVELELIRAHVVPALREGIRHFVVRQPALADSILGYTRHEFGQPSTADAWVPEPMVRLVAREESVPDLSALCVNVLGSGEPWGEVPPGACLLDVGALLRQARANH